MTGKQLKNSILQWAIQGKLVPQDPNDEPASVLLEKIRQEKERLIKEKKIKRDKNASIIFRGEDNSYYEKFLATGEVKCIDEEIPFEIPQGWEWCRLGEISTYTQPKKKINAANADAQIWGLDLEDIEKGGNLLYRKTVGERKAIGDKTIFNRGDILYSKLRPYLLKVLIAPESGICTPEIIPFTCYGDICKEYIVYLLKSSYVDDYINSVTYGVKMPRVSTETMISLLVPLPPLSEQKRIVDKIGIIMPFIDKYSKSKETLDKINVALRAKLKKSILQEAIQGKLVPQIAEEGTARELLGQIRQEKQKLVKEGKLKKTALTDSIIYKGEDNRYYEKIDRQCKDITEEIPFEIPENWEWCRMQNVINFINGRAYKKEELLDRGKYKVLRVGNFFTNIEWYYSDLELPEDKYCYNGDLLYAWSASFGPQIWEGDKTIFHYHIWNVKYDPRLLYREYLYYFFLYDKTQIKKATTGSTMIHVSMENMKLRLLPIPPLQEQQRIVAQIERLFEQLK